MKISEWLENHVGSHDILMDKWLRESFKEKVGLEPEWPCHFVGSTNAQVGKHLKGPVAVLKADDHEKCAYGWEIARGLEEKYAQTYEGAAKLGRGFAFRASVEALKAKGF